IYDKNNRYPELADLYRSELDREKDPALSVSRLYKLAELLELRLAQDEDAIKVLTHLLSIEPGHGPAAKALERLLRKHERHEELLVLLKKELELTADRDRKVYLLTEIARIAEEKRGDYDRAAAAVERILALAPRNLEAMRSLARIEERRGRFAD